MANTAWAFATLGVLDHHLLNAISAEAIRRLNEFHVLNMSNIAWAFAKISLQNKDLMSAIS